MLLPQIKVIHRDDLISEVKTRCKRADLVWKEGNVLELSAGYVEDVWTAKSETADCGAELFASSTFRRGATPTCHLDMHQCTVHRFVDFVRPESAVEVDPDISVNIQ